MMRADADDCVDPVGGRCLRRGVRRGRRPDLRDAHDPAAATELEEPT